MIQGARALAAAGLLVTIAAGAAGADDGGPLATKLPEANIVNGIPTNLQPTTGAYLFVGPDLKNQFLDCSGVLIGCRTVLTAAHCVCTQTDNYADCVNHELPKLDVADLRMFFQHAGFKHVRDIYINPSYERGVGGDLAILRLSELVTGIEPAVYHQSNPILVEDGLDGVIAGFGKSGDAHLDIAIKRVGKVTTAACPAGSGVTEPGNICWNYAGPISKPSDEANLCLADDGGPMFLDFGRGPEVAGIHAGSGSTCDAASFSYDTNVVRSRDWIKSVGGPDVQRDQCSDYAEVGEPWVHVQGSQGNLLKDQEEARFSYDIDKKSVLLRVTVNGDTEKDGDYDMFVGLDEKVPTRFDFDCKQRGTGQFGACEWTNPNVTRVNVLIRRVRPKVGIGHSRFQVTTTAWDVRPPEDLPVRGPDNLHYTKRGSDFRNLIWIDDSNNETGFELQRRAGSDPTQPFVLRKKLNANVQNYLDSIPSGNPFTYRVRAFNNFNVSEWSNNCYVNVPRIKRPTRLHTEGVTADAVTLRWKLNSTDESGVEVQRRISGALKWKKLRELPPGTRDFVDKNVDPGQNYEYRVRALAYPEECLPHSLFSVVIEVSTPVQ